MLRITVSRLFRRGIDSSCTRAYGTRLPYPSRDQPALDHHSRRPRSLGSALRIGHEQGRRVVLRQTLGRRVPLRRSATAQHRRAAQCVTAARSGGRATPCGTGPPRFPGLPATRAVARQLLGSPFTMQAIETELETAEFEALWLQARCYEGCVSVGVVRVAIRRVDELRRLAAELARGRVVNGALFWRDPCATAVAGN